jgi:alpha-N-acetylglucosaminidase
MIKRSPGFFLCIILLSVTAPAVAQLNERAAKDLIARILPGKADHFEVAYIPKEGPSDVFELESRDGKIILRGNNGVAVASALNYYLRHYCHLLITWNGTNLRLPDRLPMVPAKIHHQSPYHDRYYLNYCTFNYTMSWWERDRWQQEIDWMALNGINMPLAITGQVAVWQKVYKQMGFSDQELKDFFSGPAYFAWFWMSNLDAWGGPLPQHWIDSHETLQKKILARERSLGMTPVLPAFTGHVPPSFKKRFPDAKVNRVRWGSHFPPVNILSPEDSLFALIGTKFLKAQTKTYGTNHYYSADVFNEMTPPTGDSLYLDNISKKVYGSMHLIDTAAVWVMQGWLFHFEKKFWQPTQMKALLNAVPDNKMIILDLWSEKYPVWKRTEAYYGKYWIWDMLHNFGGRIYLEGCMPCVTDQPAELIGDPKAGKLRGLGLTMEGTEQNPAIYQLMLDNIWRNVPINLDQWIKDYVHERYGVVNKEALEAWGLLRHSVYARSPDGYGGPVSVITSRPAFTKAGDVSKNIFGYQADDLLKAWRLLLDASGALHENDGYQFDLVDVGRQVLADYAVLLEQKIAHAYRGKDRQAFKRLSSQYLSLIDDMDQLLGTRKDFLLGKWMADAKRWGVTPREKKLYAFNARDLITLWGPENSTLHDYARKQWSGLLEGFYKPRWQMFFQYADSCLESNSPLNMDVFNARVAAWEWKWVNSAHDYPATPSGSPVAVSEAMFKKYHRRVGAAFSEKVPATAYQH